MRVYLPQFRISLRLNCTLAMMVRQPTTEHRTNKTFGVRTLFKLERAHDTSISFRLPRYPVWMMWSPVLSVDRLRHDKDADDDNLCLPSVVIPLAIHC